MIMIYAFLVEWSLKRVRVAFFRRYGAQDSRGQHGISRWRHGRLRVTALLADCSLRSTRQLLMGEPGPEDGTVDSEAPAFTATAGDSDFIPHAAANNLATALLDAGHPSRSIALLLRSADLWAWANQRLGAYADALQGRRRCCFCRREAPGWRRHCCSACRDGGRQGMEVVHDQQCEARWNQELQRRQGTMARSDGSPFRGRVRRRGEFTPQGATVR